MVHENVSALFTHLGIGCDLFNVKVTDADASSHVPMQLKILTMTKKKRNESM